MKFPNTAETIEGVRSEVIYDLFTKEQVRAARLRWAEFLMKKSRKKGFGILDDRNGERCCLGHGCYLFKEIPKVNEWGEWKFGDEKNTAYAPRELVEILGLHDSKGGNPKGHLYPIFATDYLNEANTLAEVNDDTKATPQRIGKYLLSVIEGGEDTPFRALSLYKA